MANNFPIVIDGAPVGAAPWFNPIAEAVTDLQNNLTPRVTSLEARGFVIDKSDVTSNVTTTTIEVVSSYIQWTGTSGRRYKITYSCTSASTVAGDLAILRLRSASSTSDVTGTVLRNQKIEMSAAKGRALELTGRVNCLATGVQTVVATIVRDSGTGSVSANGATAGSELYFMIEDLGTF